MYAFTASTSEKMESLSAEGPGWQVSRVSGRYTGGEFSTLADQNMDEWGWASVVMWMSWLFDFSQNTLL